MIEKKTKNIIVYAQIIFKIYYDFRYKFIDLKIKQNVHIKFHKKYFQSDLKNRKYNKHRLKFVKIIKKNRLIYKLNISKI